MTPSASRLTMYRYHFVKRIQGLPWVDRPFHPIPRYNQPGGCDFVVANLPYGSSSSPIFIPWTNIAYVECLGSAS